MYFFPRQLLIRYFWTPKQQEEFMDIYHRMRVEAYPEILEGLLKAIPKLSERNLRNPMFQLCTQKALCRVMFLTPHLPAFLLQRRLGSHICEIQNLDCALLKLGVNKLSEEELKQACYIRGINSTHLSMEDCNCKTWLNYWLKAPAI
ncbi:hypothetical protein XELAEV_18015964mg [Xenopus laevis]|uniref:Letm1 RBD domain-containing protein n=1 Tax=Xenopus laevis TaxID=8355 RepID=A0A974HWL1_XENLA|nr:hypothetical protein XELAEV_18015964mg [Xenopus laevis]